MARALNRALGYPQELKKNYIVNGAMMVSQENGSTAGTTSSYYPVDQFAYGASHGGVVSIAQVSSVTPAGSPNRIRATVTTADAAVAAGDFAVIQTKIEGYRVSDLRFGSVFAKTITLKFGVKGPAGTYCVGFRNTGTARSYIAEFTISGGEANTDVYKSVTIAGDQSGTWLTNNGVGLDIVFALMSGSTFQTAVGAWTAGNFVASANQFNFLGTLSNVFELYDVGLYEGTVAPDFQVPDYPDEYRLCQRYMQVLQGAAGAPIATGVANATNNALMVVPLSAPLRAQPTVTVSSLSHYAIYNPAVAPTSLTNTALVTDSTMRMDVAIGSALFATGQGAWMASVNAAAKLIINARM